MSYRIPHFYTFALSILAFLLIRWQLQEISELGQLHDLISEKERKIQELKDQYPSDDENTVETITEMFFNTESLDYEEEKEQIRNITVKLNKKNEDQKKSLTSKPETQINCDKPKLGLPHQFPIIPLVSQPGAGNTWVRHLIEQATGYLTGSVYHDANLYFNLKGEMTSLLDQQTIVVKSHSINRVKGTILNYKPPKPTVETDLPKVMGCIMIIRNPRDAMLAEFTRQHSGGHTGSLNKQRLQTQEWNDRIESASKGFPKTYLDVVKYCDSVTKKSKNYKLIVYEELKESEENILKIMEEVVDYINSIIAKYYKDVDNKNHSITFQKRCLAQNLEGKYHRKSSRDWDVADYFSDTAKCNLNANVRLMNAIFDSRLPKSYLIDESKFSCEKVLPEKDKTAYNLKIKNLANGGFSLSEAIDVELLQI